VSRHAHGTGRKERGVSYKGRAHREKDAKRTRVSESDANLPNRNNATTSERDPPNKSNPLWLTIYGECSR
jgi:hypothetical protein